MSKALKKAYRRHQTLILALLTFAMMLYSAVFVFDVNPVSLGQMLLIALGFLLGLMSLAALTVASLKLLLKFRR